MEKTEMQRLADKLYDKGIPFQMMPMDEKMFEHANQIFYPSKRECTFDFVCHKYSYGYDEGLLEMMDHRTEETVGDLTAADAFEFILHDYVNG